MVLGVAWGRADPLEAKAETDEVKEAVAEVKAVHYLPAVDASLVQVKQLRAFNEADSGGVDHRRGCLIDERGARRG